ncbi:MAG: serine/threonine protein kinase [Phycisphaerales bacterium]|nr:serine/threonine protein kinase [Phycisphaerales bacterium]
MAGEDESQLGRKLVESRLVSADEIALCKERRRELVENGHPISLLDLLIQEGYVTRSQISRVNRAMDDDSMYRPAQQIPGFQIISKLGQGAMATVYKARQLSLDRIVAIKVLPKRLSENQEFVDRFYREGRAAAQLNHPNIVQAIDVGEAGGYHYFVMEYVDGKTVYDQLQNDKALSEGLAVKIVLQTAMALDHAHARGFIHRDVKPKNIMLGSHGEVKLADMGLAREVSDYQTAQSEAGRAYGTPYYISPEQIRGEINIDFRADVYSLGATFYHTVTGKVPFEGATPSAVMHKHLKEELVPPDHLAPTLSAGIGEVIELMMSKQRDDRYGSTRELIADLEAVARGEPPFQARKKYDRKLLEDLAKSGHIVSRANAEDLDPSITIRREQSSAKLNLFVMSLLFVISVVVNIALWVMYR